jgi:hypothetical protein
VLREKPQFHDILIVEGKPLSSTNARALANAEK